MENSYSNFVCNCVISDSDTKLDVPLVTWSVQDNPKLLQQLKSRSKRTINWNKYHSNVSRQTQNQYLGFLVDPSFQAVNRLFVLLFESDARITGRVGSMILIQLSVFSIPYFGRQGQYLRVKQPANSCKQAALVAGVQGLQ